MMELSVIVCFGFVCFMYMDKNKGFFLIDVKLNGNSDLGSMSIIVNNVVFVFVSDGWLMSGQVVVLVFCMLYGMIWNVFVYFYVIFDKLLCK